MFNKNRSYIASDKKKLIHSHKGWLVCSAALLAALGIGSAKQLTTHADTVPSVSTSQQMANPSKMNISHSNENDDEQQGYGNVDSNPAEMNQDLNRQLNANELKPTFQSSSTSIAKSASPQSAVSHSTSSASSSSQQMTPQKDDSSNDSAESKNSTQDATPLKSAKIQLSQQPGYKGVPKKARTLAKHLNKRLPSGLHVVPNTVKHALVGNVGVGAPINSNVSVSGNPVQYNATILLHFHNSTGVYNTISIPVSVHSEVGNYVNLLDGYQGGTPDNTNANKFINTNINGFDTHSFSANNSNMGAYDFMVQPGANSGHTTNTLYYNPTINLDFYGQPVTDTVNYFNGGKQVGSVTHTGTKGDVVNVDQNFPLPYGYHMNDGTTLQLDSGVHNETVVPNQVTQTINYMWYGQNKGTGYMTGTFGTYGSANSQGLNPGWHINSDGSQNFTYTGQSQNVDIAPNTVNDNVYYQYNGQTLGSHTFSGNDYRTGVNGTFAPGNYPSGIPAHYHVISPGQSINYDGGNHYVAIYGDNVTDSVNYIYRGYGNVISNSLHPQGAFNTANSINWNNAQVPANWHLSYDGTQNFNYNTGSHNVDIDPNQSTDTIQYMDEGAGNGNGQYLGSTQYSGNNIGAQGAVNRSFQIGTAPTNLPWGYHVANPSQSFNYDGGTHQVALTPNNVNENINYMYQNSNEGSGTMNGPYKRYDNPNGQGLKPGWHVVPGSQIQYMNNVTRVTVTPNIVTDHIHYTGDGANNWQNIQGNDARTGVNPTFNINNSNNHPGLPMHYHVNNAQTIPYDAAYNNNGNHDVPVTRNTSTQSITYYGLGANKNVGNTTQTFRWGLNGTADGSNMPIGWHLADDGTQNFTYGAPYSNGDNGASTINVTPNIDTDTINYQLNDRTLGSTTVKGNDWHTGVNGTVTINGDSISSNGFHPNIPAHYHTVSSNTFNYDNGTHNVAIAPDTVTETIHYVDSKGAPLGTGTMTGLFTDKAMADGKGLEAGWHVDTSRDQFTYNCDGSATSTNGNMTAYALPDQVTDTITYSGDTVTPATQTFTGNDYRTEKDINGNPTGLVGTITFKNGNKPEGIQAHTHINGDQVIPFDAAYNNNGKHTVTIIRDNATEKINYMWFNQNVGTYTYHSRYGLKGVSNGEGIDAGWNIEPYYGSQNFTFTDSEHNVDVKPALNHTNIQYMIDGAVIGTHTFTGNDYRSGVSDTFLVDNSSAGLPKNCHVVKSQTFTYNGNTYNVNIATNSPLPETDNITTINYVVNAPQDPKNNLTVGTAIMGGPKDGYLTVGTDPNNLPENYKVITPNATIPYDNKTHTVYVEPNEAAPVTFNYVNQAGSTVGYVTLANLGLVGQKVNIAPDLSKHVPFGYYMPSSQPIMYTLTNASSATVNI